MLANRRKRNSNTLLRAIDASENESFCSVFVKAFDLKDSFFVINENIFNLNHTYKVTQKPRKVKKNFQLFYCTILLRGGPRGPIVKLYFSLFFIATLLFPREGGGFYCESILFLGIG